MQHSKKFLAFFGALLCTLPLLMGPTGGLPSRPTFQSVTVSGGGANSLALAGSGSLINAQVRNSLAGTATASAYYLLNDSSNAFRMLYSSSANTTAFVTSGPTGPAGYFYTTAAEPISIGTNGIERLRVAGAGAVTIAGVDVTPATATSTGTVTGCTTAPTNNFHLNKIANMAVLSMDGAMAGCTSNATTFTMTAAIPAAFQPARNQVCNIDGLDNGAHVPASILIAPGSTTLTVNTNTATGVWTAAGSKAAVNISCAYNLN